jgi:ribosome-binding factor A
MTASKDLVPQSQRQLRVAEQIRQLVSEVLQRIDFHEPLLSAAHVSIAEVRMSPDLRHGRLYVISLLGKDVETVVTLLNTYEPKIRKHIAKGLTLKFLPKLRFYCDDTFFEASRIDSLLKSKHVARDLSAKNEQK